MSNTSRCITANDRVALYKYYCFAFEWTSGVGTRSIELGDVKVNEVVITNPYFEVKDGDIIKEFNKDQVEVVIPPYWRESVRNKRSEKRARKLKV